MELVELMSYKLFLLKLVDATNCQHQILLSERILKGTFLKQPKIFEATQLHQVVPKHTGLHYIWGMLC